jgi:uncharacterized protein (TIGR02594 family)
MTCYDIAQRYIGLKEILGPQSNPFILWCYTLCDNSGWAHDDAVPWCSAFQQHPAWELRLPRSKSLRARSWLNVGRPISIDDATPGNDMVILRNNLTDPGPDVIDFAGHVTLFAGLDGSRFLGLGGNQSDAVNIAYFDKMKVLGVRRLA